MNADDSILQIDPTNRYVCYKEEVGKGAFKTVYKAFDRVEGIEVAWNQVKIEDVALSPPQELERLNEEVELLRSLKHRNILKLCGSWVDEDKKTLNIITELFTSGSLRQYCKKHKKVDIRAVKGWARQILSGLVYLHGQKPPVIHRDIKCDNIFINGNRGEVKIGDFGLAMVMRQDSPRSVLGTPGFVAPELYDEDYNELVDIYSFGMCILQMVTSEYPYSECENSAQIFKKVCSGIKPVGLSKVIDPEVKAFIEKCIAPASERLPARELLKDPFIRVSRLNGCKTGYPLPYPSLKSSIVPDNPCVLSEESKIDDHLNVSCSSRVDFHHDKPPIIDVITSFSEGKFLSRALSIRKRENGDEFVLVAEKKDEHSVSFKLQIARWKALSLRNDFVFHFEMDTSITVAARMVEEHKVTVADGVYISELIDTLLVNLTSDWHPSVAIDRLAILENKELYSCMTETSPTAILIPSEPSCHELPLLGPLIQPACGADDSPKLDGFTDVDNPSSNDDDEQLKWELEIIKLHYHEVMNYVSRKMNDALVDAGKRAAKKKVPASPPLLKG